MLEKIICCQFLTEIESVNLNNAISILLVVELLSEKSVHNFVSKHIVDYKTANYYYALLKQCFILKNAKYFVEVELLLKKIQSVIITLQHFKVKCT